MTFTQGSQPEHETFRSMEILRGVEAMTLSTHTSMYNM
jgi:hypothetical protein